MKGDTALMERLGRDYIRCMADVFRFYEALSDRLLQRRPAQVQLLHANALSAEYLDQLAAMIAERGYWFISLDEALCEFLRTGFQTGMPVRTDPPGWFGGPSRWVARSWSRPVFRVGYTP
jgi:hypothetical protein